MLPPFSRNKGSQKGSSACSCPHRGNIGSNNSEIVTELTYKTNNGKKHVQFMNTVKVFTTIGLDEMTKEEIHATWFNGNDWENIKKDIHDAKTKCCPTVDRMQPYNIQDRRSTIKYVQSVVLREQATYRKKKRTALNQLKLHQKLSPSTASSIKLPCKDCSEEKTRILYHAATRMSREHAILSGRLVAKDVQNMLQADDNDNGRVDFTSLSKMDLADRLLNNNPNTNNRRKLFPTIISSVC
jgi:hypothetical protein